MKQAHSLGQKMDQARARFRRAVEPGEKAMEALQEAQENFEQAQHEVFQAQTDLDRLMQEAPPPVMPVPQDNVSLVKTLEALTGIIENMWNPDAGQPPDHLIHAIQESRAMLQTCSVMLSRKVGAALDAELDAEQNPELWDLDENEAEEKEGFEEAHAPGGPPVEATRTRKAAAERTPVTPPPKKTRTAAPGAVEHGGAQPSQVQRLSPPAMQNPRDTELPALSQRACAMLPALTSF